MYGDDVADVADAALVRKTMTWIFRWFLLVFPGGGMQEPCKERDCAGASPTLDIVKREIPSWTPEDFLQ